MRRRDCLRPLWRSQTEIVLQAFNDTSAVTILKLILQLMYQSIPHLHPLQLRHAAPAAQTLTYSLGVQVLCTFVAALAALCDRDVKVPPGLLSIYWTLEAQMALAVLASTAPGLACITEPSSSHSPQVTHPGCAEKKLVNTIILRKLGSRATLADCRSTG